MLDFLFHICSLIYNIVFNFLCLKKIQWSKQYSKSIIFSLHVSVICLIFAFLPAALSGNFVNFSIFELYGDRALFDALDITIKLMLSIPLGDIFAFRKVLLYFYVMFFNLLSWLMKDLLSSICFLFVCCKLQCTCNYEYISLSNPTRNS